MQFENLTPSFNLNLEIDLDQLLTDLNLIEIDFKKYFDTHKSNLESLIQSLDFMQDLKNRKLKSSQLFDTRENADLLNQNIQFIFLYSLETEADLDVPVYLIIQTENDNIKMYYTEEDISDFYNKLSSRIITITDNVNDQKWIYMTSNSGMNWSLQNTENENDIFKQELYGEELQKLIQQNNYKFEVSS
jgi:hypothetical protein